MSVNMQKLETHPTYPATGCAVEIVDYYDGHWKLAFGTYGSQFAAILSTEDISALTALLSAMLLTNEQEMAALSGDYENESKMDVHNTEAWLDIEG